MCAGGFAVAIQKLKPGKESMSRGKLRMLLDDRLGSHSSLGSFASQKEHSSDANLGLRAAGFDREQVFEGGLGVIERPFIERGVREEQQ